MQLPTPFVSWGEHLAIELPGARAVFTTRRGGTSQGPYASLNLGRLTGDDPDAVRRNREWLQRRAAGRLAMIRQVHSARVVRRTVPQEASGPVPAGDLEEADGQATRLAGIAPVVLTADCLPIVIAGGGAVAVLHAGWRGLAAGVIPEGARAVRAWAQGEPLEAAIGPGAGGCCYEVGNEVRRHFADYDREVHRGGKLDLKAIARAQLAAAGVSEIHDARLCTICSPPELFFSHRRDRGITGRQAGVAWLT